MKTPSGKSARRPYSRKNGSEAENYARKRWSSRKQRDAKEHAEFDPRPVTDDDWSVENEGDEPSLTRVSPPQAISDVLGNLVNQQGWASRLNSSRLFRHWNDVCGQELATHCEPVRLAGGILVLRVESQIWATQLRYCVPEITQNIRTRLGIDTIRDVRIVVGPLENESR